MPTKGGLRAHLPLNEMRHAASAIRTDQFGPELTAKGLTAKSSRFLRPFLKYLQSVKLLF
jgi:hypothetical protein